MITENQIRQMIYRKIRRLPDDKLNELVDYLNKLEHSNPQTSKVLAFAGCWHNIDDSAFEELTENVIKNRARNSRRFHE